MAGVTGLEPATSGVTGQRSKPTELHPRFVSLDVIQALATVKERRPARVRRWRGTARIVARHYA